MLILLNSSDINKKAYHLYDSIKDIIRNQKECYILINTVEEYDVIVRILEDFDIKWRSGHRATELESYRMEVDTDYGNFFIVINFSDNKSWITQGINTDYYFENYSKELTIINDEKYWDRIEGKKRGVKLDSTSETK